MTSACRFPTDNVPIYFNPGVLWSYNYNPDVFREVLINAMMVWRQQSLSRVNPYFAGTTSAVSIPGAIVVNHDASPTSRSATAIFYTGSCPGPVGVIINVHMVNQSGVPRVWTPYWQFDPTTFVSSYEAVLVHELGHAAFGFPDTVPQPTGVMVGSFGRYPAGLILYPEDIIAAVSTYSPSSEIARTVATTNLGATWSASAYFDASTTTTSFPPSLTPTDSSSQPVAGVLSTWTSSRVLVRHGNHGTFAAYADTPSEVVWHESHAAVSSYGETMVVFPVDCNRDNFCSIYWAWTYNDGSTWVGGKVLTPPAWGTYTRPSVAYDPYRDAFVLAYISGVDSEIYTLSTPAAAVNWGASTRLRPTSDSFAKPFRHMGGMVFDSAGTGLIAATALWDEAPTYYNNPIATPIVQANLTWNGSQYVLGNIGYNRYYSTRGEARTRVPFGLSRSAAGQIFMAWRGTSNSRRLTFSTKSSISATSWFSPPTESLIEAPNGVTVSAAGANFVAGYSSQ